MGIILDMFIECGYITSMARHIKEIMREIDSLRSIRHKHLIKLYYYRGQNNYNNEFSGWVESARKGFEDVPKVKGTNKYPDFNKLYEWCWKSVEDSFDDFHKGVVADLNYKNKNFENINYIAYNEVRTFVENYNKWACKEISQKGHITIEETENKIKELLCLQ